MVVGSLIHAVLGQHYRAAPDARSEDKLHAWLDAQSSVGGFDDVFVGQAKMRAHTILTRFAKRYGNDGIQPLGIEMSLTRTLPSGIAYHGFADMVYEDGDMIVVEDWKTSLSTIDPTKHTVFNPQGRDYLWALSEKYDPARLVMSWLIMTPSSMRRIQTPIGEIKDVAAELDALAVEERSLAILPSYDAKCMWCPYRALCETKLTGGDVATTFRESYVQEARIIELEGDDADAI